MVHLETCQVRACGPARGSNHRSSTILHIDLFIRKNAVQAQHLCTVTYTPDQALCVTLCCSARRKAVTDFCAGVCTYLSRRAVVRACG